MRRLVAAGGLVVVLILFVVLIKGCVSNQQTTALKDYNRSVRSLADESRNDVGRPLFSALSGATSQSQNQLQDTLNQLGVDADRQATQAAKLSTPDAVKEAQHDFVLLMSLRRDAVKNIARLYGPAVGRTAASSAAVDQIAGQMRAFDASDVLYSQRVAPLILRGLKSNGIAASYDGSAGEQVEPQSNFLSNIGWISPTFVGQQLGASTGGSSSSANARPAPGLHGHQLDSVSVGGTTLSPDSSAQIPASPPPTFTVNFTNGGDNPETNVKVDVRVSTGASTVRGQATVPSTSPHTATTANVTLDSAPPTDGPATITVTIERVPGETSTDNNTASYTALFTTG